MNDLELQEFLANKNLKGKDFVNLAELQKAIILTGDAYYITKFARDVPGAVILTLQEAIILTGNAEYITKFTLNVKGVKYSKNKLFIDFEFTGLDNEFDKTNSIIETKLIITDKDYNIIESKNWIHKSRKKNNKGSFLCNRIKPKYQTSPSFSSTFFEKEVLAKYPNYRIYGFGNSLDKKMLEKYGIQIEFIDLQKALMLSRFEKELASSGSSLETCYYITTGKIPSTQSHWGMEELNYIVEIAKVVATLRPRKYLTVMPWGFCRGMPISQYCEEHRRNADGYRLNNDDILSTSLSQYIEWIQA